MALDRKTLRLALVNALAARMTADGDPLEFLTKDINPRNVAAGRFPILVVEAADENPETDERPVPPVWHLSMDVTMYARPDTNDLDPDSVLDVLVAHLEAALERQADEKTATSWWTTLGGQCLRAYPSGQGSRYQDEAGNVWATQPIEIKAVTRARGIPAP